MVYVHGRRHVQRNPCAHATHSNPPSPPPFPPAPPKPPPSRRLRLRFASRRTTRPPTVKAALAATLPAAVQSPPPTPPELPPFPPPPTFPRFYMRAAEINVTRSTSTILASDQSTAATTTGTPSVLAWHQLL